MRWTDTPDPRYAPDADDCGGAGAVVWCVLTWLGLLLIIGGIYAWAVVL